MSTNQIRLQQFIAELNKSLASATFIKMSLSNYIGNEKDLKNVYVRKVLIKRVEMLSLTYRYQTRDLFKNFSIAAGADLLGQLLSNDFQNAVLFTTESEWVFQLNKKQDVVVREKKLKIAPAADLGHDRKKNRLIASTGKAYLRELNIADEQGKVFKSAQDKYKQINQYISILSSLIRELPGSNNYKVVDMGAGKGYLTFALYDYLTGVLGTAASVTGVEYRDDLVKLCNNIAQGSGFGGLQFVQGTIEDYSNEDIDILIALHACDTATDDAIEKGIRAGAELIVVAPCCHKQVRKAMEASAVKNEISFLTRYGIFLERQAEMVTDGIRALVLSYFGYKTKVVEFISDAHTPKNVLLIGIRADGKIKEAQKEAVLKQIKDAQAYFGLDYHHLVRAMKIFGQD